MIHKMLLPAVLIAGMAGFVSCRNRHTTPPAPVTRQMNFASLRYDSAALEYRLDSLQNRGLVFQCYLSQGADNNSNFQLISYAYDSLGDHNNSWIPDTLSVIADSVPKTLAGRVIIGNTELTRDQFYDVLNKPDGKRVSYDYMLFTPVVEGVFHHLVYRIRPIKNGQPAEGTGNKMQMSTPMPPSRVWD